MNIYYETNMETPYSGTENWYKELERKQKLSMKCDDDANNNNGKMIFSQCLAWARWEIPHVDIISTL